MSVFDATTRSDSVVRHIKTQRIIKIGALVAENDYFTPEHLHMSHNCLEDLLDLE